MRKNRALVYLVPLIISTLIAAACGTGETQGAAPATIPVETASTLAPTPTSATTSSSPPVTVAPPDIPVPTQPPTTTAPPWARQVVARPDALPGCIPANGNTKSATQFGAKPQIAITVDDFQRNEDPDQLNRLLDVAAFMGVKLTLFPTGKGLQVAINQGKQEVWRRAVREGHIIGNHTYDHASLPGIGIAAIRGQLQRQQDKLNEVLGYDYPEILMRPPGGNGALGCRMSTDVAATAKEFGYVTAVWTIDSNGTGGNEDFRWQILNTKPLANGAIILTHLQTFSVENFGPLVQGLRDKGYDLVTLNQMLGLPLCAPVNCEPAG